MAVHRLIVDPPLPGAWNMAVDEALLSDAIDNGIATLRFYQWNEPTLSLGYFQTHDDRFQHAASRDCACVRRQTGGGAILHDRELTYSLALPSDHPLAKHTQSLYESIHDAFIAELSPLIENGQTGHVLIRRNQESTLDSRAEPFLCFQRRARGDVVWCSPNSRGEPSTGSQPSQPDWKILGSAQRRHRGAILQHGSLLLNRSTAAPELDGLNDLAATRVQPDALAIAVSHSVADILSLELAPAELSPPLKSMATQLANKKYGEAAWTNRR